MIKSLGSVPYDRIPVVCGTRVCLRAFDLGLFEAACGMWADPEVVRYIGGEPRSQAMVWAALQRGIGSWAVLGYGYWAVVDRNTGAFLGEAGFLDGLRDLKPAISGIPEAGWCLARSAWGQGIATEVVTLMHDWADGALAAPETACIIDQGNEASVRVATKTGYVLAGLASFGSAQTQLFRRQSRTSLT